MRSCNLLCSPTRPRPVVRFFPGAWLLLSKLGSVYFAIRVAGRGFFSWHALNSSLHKAPLPLPLAQPFHYDHSGVNHGRLTICNFPELRDSWLAGQNLCESIRLCGILFEKRFVKGLLCE